MLRIIYSEIILHVLFCSVEKVASREQSQARPVSQVQTVQQILKVSRISVLVFLKHSDSDAIIQFGFVLGLLHRHTFGAADTCLSADSVTKSQIL
jgi:hypothetical protein